MEEGPGGEGRSEGRVKELMAAVGQVRMLLLAGEGQEVICKKSDQGNCLILRCLIELLVLTYPWLWRLLDDRRYVGGPGRELVPAVGALVLGVELKWKNTKGLKINKKVSP